MVKLQLALDVATLEDAISMAEKLRDYVDIIELGTFLVKEESAAEAIMVMKKLFPEKLILADFKTMDTGKIEAGVAFDAGADIMTVCGTASDSTIKAAIKKARQMKKKVMVDLIGAQNKLVRAAEIVRFRPHYICIHTAIDDYECPFEELVAISEEIKIPLAVAGGINRKNIRKIMKLKPEIIILGRAFTKAKNPVREAQIINRIAGRKILKSKREEKEPFVKIINVIESEIKDTLKKISPNYTRKLIKLLLKSKSKNNSIFVTGEGRSGLIGRAFAMRLMHLGFKSHFIGESTTPSIQRKDVLIAVSGSGKNNVVLERVMQARKRGAIVITITTNNHSEIVRNSKFIIEIPAFSDSKMEPLGSLFEQSALLYLDGLVVSLMASLEKSPPELRKFQANL